MSRNYYEHTDPYRSYDAQDEDRSVLGNPLPLALIGLGVGWLVWSNTSHPGVDARLRDASRRARQYGDRALNRAEEFRDQAVNRASELRDQVSNRTSEWVDEAGNRASEWRDRAGNATQSVRDRVQSQTGGQRQDFSRLSGQTSPAIATVRATTAIRRRAVPARATAASSASSTSIRCLPASWVLR